MGKNGTRQRERRGCLHMFEGEEKRREELFFFKAIKG